MRVWRSLGVRAKLTLTAVAVITLLYAFLGLTVQFAARRVILGSIDAGLLSESRLLHSIRDDRPPPPPGDGPPDGMQRGRVGAPNDRFGFHPDRRTFARVAEVDIHDVRPKLVWVQGGAHFPFPQSKPIDIAAVSLARSGIQTLRTVSFQNEPVRVLTMPLRRPEQKRIEAVVQFSYWIGDVDKTLDSLARTLILILPCGILLMGAASMFVVGRTLQPIRDIRAAAARIEAENLSGRLKVSGADEFAELAETMNGMLGRLDVAFASQRRALDQISKMLQQQQRFTADASHELKTPLTIIKVHASLLKGYLQGKPEALESVTSVDEAVNRMSKLVQDLLLLARTDAGQLGEQFEPVDLHEVLVNSAAQVPCAARIRVGAEEGLRVLGSVFALERLVTNLLDNACRHSDEGTQVVIGSRTDGKWAIIEVVDQGEGIPQVHLTHIFDRFHRVDGSRHSATGGAGLGLAICKGIVEAHRGEISLQSVLGRGTTVTVKLPIHLTNDFEKASLVDMETGPRPTCATPWPDA